MVASTKFYSLRYERVGSYQFALIWEGKLCRGFVDLLQEAGNATYSSLVACQEAKRLAARLPAFP